MTSSKQQFPEANWNEWSGTIAAALGLKKMSHNEHHGPCPNCGGTDRFWISQHQEKVAVHCRQCGDFKAIKDALRAQSLWPAVETVPSSQAASRDDLSDFEDTRLYHQKKSVGLHGARIEGRSVVIDLTNLAGETVGRQTITPDGKKKFSTGLVKDGTMSVVGGSLAALEGRVYIAEGWATSASVHEATGRPCVFALDAGNLPKVAKALVEAHPGLDLVVAADHDEAGLKAAITTGLPYAAPTGAGDDWNDIHQREGATAVSDALGRATAEAGGDIHPLARFLDPLPAKTAATEFVIDGVLAAGMTTLAGGWGAGKTSQLVPLLARAAWLCRFDDPLKPKLRRKVVYVSEDVGQVQRILGAMAANDDLGDDLGAVSDFFKIVQAERLSADYAVGVVEQYATLTTTNVNQWTAVSYEANPIIVFDTRSAVLDLQDENDNSEAGRVISTLRRGFDGFPILIVGHLAKALRRADTVNMSGRGAGAWEADVQQVLYLTKEDDGTRYLDVSTPKHRFSTKIEGILFDGVRATIGAVDVLGDRVFEDVFYGAPTIVENGGRAERKEEAAKAQKAAADTALRKEILEYAQTWRAAHVALSRTVIAERVGGQTAKTYSAIEMLVSEGWLVEQEIPASIRSHHTRKAFIVGLTAPEREKYLNAGILPDGADVPPVAFTKPRAAEKSSLPDDEAKPSKADGNADFEPPKEEV